MNGNTNTKNGSGSEHTKGFKHYPNNSLRAPTLDWREMPSHQDVVLNHFKALHG